MAACKLLMIALALGAVSAANLAVDAKGSPVQMVLQLMDECRAKIVNDIKTEQSAMDEYMIFSHREIGEKANAIKSATRDIADLDATIAENDALIQESTDEIANLGKHIAGKQGELLTATNNRKSQHAEFVAAETELLDAVGETERAVAQLKQGTSFAQIDKSGLRNVVAALQRVIESAAIIGQAPKEKLQAFVQSATDAAQSDELVTSFKTALRQPAEPAFESKSGAILETVEDMQKKAEDQLSELRQKEMENNHAHEMLADMLGSEISQSTGKLQASQSLKAACEQKLAQAQEDLGATQKTKADDEAYLATTKQETQMKAQEFEERSQSAKGELGAIDKAKSILQTGVVALVQTGTAGGKAVAARGDDDERRLRAATKLRSLGKQYHKIGLMELATAVASDPFGKIRGLIEDMVAKLQAEAAEAATQKAFCDEEMGKSNAAKNIKETKIEKHQNRMDQASSEIAELTDGVKRLESEIAEIDAAVSEATSLRNKEHAENTQAMADFKQSADAVMAAIATLKSFYEGTSLLQKGQRRVNQPEFASAKSDSGSGIVSVLELAESDFTALFAETEAAENAAASAYTKLSNENKLARAQKETDAKGKRSEIKSLEVTLAHNTEDHASVSSELDAVNAYLDKLKPQCETKVMSYAERKAAREAEIEGLKDALSTLQGN